MVVRAAPLRKVESFVVFSLSLLGNGAIHHATFFLREQLKLIVQGKVCIVMVRFSNGISNAVHNSGSRELHAGWARSVWPWASRCCLFIFRQSTCLLLRVSMTMQGNSKSHLVSIVLFLSHSSHVVLRLSIPACRRGHGRGAAGAELLHLPLHPVPWCHCQHCCA